MSQCGCSDCNPCYSSRHSSRHSSRCPPRCPPKCPPKCPPPCPTGPAGPTGAPGENGLDGPTGAPGQNGLDGPTGAPGQNGLDGATGAPGQNGLDGPTGAPGQNGQDGATGAPGQNGLDGATGAPGQNGLDGPTGAPGQNGLDGVTGAPGLDGVTGPTGECCTGPTGEPGPPGINPFAQVAYVYSAQNFIGEVGTVVPLELSGTLASGIVRLSPSTLKIMIPGAYLALWHLITTDGGGLELTLDGVSVFGTRYEGGPGTIGGSAPVFITAGQELRLTVVNTRSGVLSTTNSSGKSVHLYLQQLG